MDGRSRSGTGAEAVLGEIEALLAELHPGATARVDLGTDLVSGLGLDSLALVELHDRLERAFGVELPDEVLASATTPGDWLRAITERRGAAPVAAGLLGPRPAPPPPGDWPRDAETLAEALTWHAGTHPDVACIRILGGEDRPADELTYGALLAEASAVARGLLDDGLDRGDRVAIMLPTGRHYFVTFLAAILAGGVPVPIYPPARLAGLEEHLRRQALLLENAGATTLVTVPEARLAGRLVRLHVPSLRTVRTPDALRAVGGGRPLPAVGANDTALVQYTSGSTGDPKGVVLTHAQLLANVRAMGQAIEVSPSDVFVSWLPLYHDMGLIGAWHASLLFGFSLVIMSPLQFLARPVAWLRAISAYGGTLSAAPNFAYQSCVDRIPDHQLEGLDLSRWRLAFNGSEPVSALTLTRFVERFSSRGFRAEAMCPAYGLAEVGVGLTFTPLGQVPRVDLVAGRELAASGRADPVAADEPGAVAVVSCGVPLPGYEVRVVGPLGEELADRHEGRVECRGPSATTRYFANDEATRHLWHRDWLDTGDLGYRVGADVYLTGRAKDLVIKAGRNLHPEELEHAVGELDGARRGGVAAFADTDPRRGTERLVVVVETKLGRPEEQAALRELVVTTTRDLLDAAPDEVVLAPEGAVRRTPSGKIRRAATRDAWKAGELGRRPAPVLVQLPRFAAAGVRRAARRAVGSVGVGAFAVYAWAIAAVVAAPWWLAMHLPMPIGWRWALTRAAVRTLQSLTGIHLRTDGALPPPDVPVVVVANHPSFLDALVMVLVAAHPVTFVASSDLEHHALYGGVLRRLACAFVHRGEAERSTEEVERLGDLARRGHRLVVFPEGSITRAAGLRPFRLGAFAVAAEAGCPVLPVGIRGTHDRLRPGSTVLRPGDITVAIGSPIPPGGRDFAARVHLAEQARQAIAELSGEREVS